MLGQQFRTADLYFAAYLKVAGVPFVEAKKGSSDDGRPKIFFFFEDTEAIPDLKRQYFGRVSKVIALSYVDEIRSMKTLAHMG